MLSPDIGARWKVARAFVVTGMVAVVGGGMLAAGVAHNPLQYWVWMSAYLVLIVGVAQVVFGAGQAWLSGRLPSMGWVAGEWFVFNLGNAGVIAGAVLARFELVLAGTALFAIAIALFLGGTHSGRRTGWLTGYRVVLGLVFASSLVGLVISATHHLR